MGRFLLSAMANNMGPESKRVCSIQTNLSSFALELEAGSREFYVAVGKGSTKEHRIHQLRLKLLVERKFASFERSIVSTFPDQAVG